MACLYIEYTEVLLSGTDSQKADHVKLNLYWLNAQYARFHSSHDN